jgi:hypothetical protein
MKALGLFSAALSVLAIALSSDASDRTPGCATRALTLEVKRTGAGGGTTFYAIGLRNRSAHACKLGGWPGVSLLDAKHRQLGNSAKRTGSPSHRFTLKPGRVATAVFTAASGECGTGLHAARSTYVRVYPPGQRASEVVNLHALACGLMIAPLRKTG